MHLHSSEVLGMVLMLEAKGDIHIVPSTRDAPQQPAWPGAELQHQNWAWGHCLGAQPGSFSVQSWLTARVHWVCHKTWEWQLVFPPKMRQYQSQLEIQREFSSPVPVGISLSRWWFRATALSPQGSILVLAGLGSSSPAWGFTHTAWAAQQNHTESTRGLTVGVVQLMDPQEIWGALSSLHKKAAGRVKWVYLTLCRELRADGSRAPVMVWLFWSPAWRSLGQTKSSFNARFVC